MTEIVIWRALVINERGEVLAWRRLQENTNSLEGFELSDFMLPIGHFSNESKEQTIIQTMWKAGFYVTNVDPYPVIVNVLEPNLYVEVYLVEGFLLPLIPTEEVEEVMFIDCETLRVSMKKHGYSTSRIEAVQEAIRIFTRMNRL